MPTKTYRIPAQNVDQLKEHGNVDGVTLTLHTQGDVAGFYRLNEKLLTARLEPKSLRLNVFKGIKVDVPIYWQVKWDIVWLKNCPLPSNEVFMRLAADHL